MPGPAKVYLFGPVRLMPDRRALSTGGNELPIKSRAFDLLLALIERRERIVGKTELMDLVWPGRVVEEGNLTVHIAALRKLLGSGVITTVPGRGYRFVAPVEEVEADTGEQPVSGSSLSPVEAGHAEGEVPPAALPRMITRLLGRAEDLDRVEARLDASRLVTIVGAGGIGKTRLAIATADRVSHRFPGGVWLADAGSLEDPELIPTAIAAAVGIEVRHGDVLGGVILFLGPRRGLLLLDGVEHMLGTVARAAEAILRACPKIVILVTSREPLRAEGENLHRLQPLSMPPPGQPIPAAELDAHAATELFVERARALLGDFAPTDAEAREIAEICWRLDGIPLAIELAVPTLQALPLSELRARLDHRFGPLMTGRRTALPRQRTLGTTIGWSLDLLEPAERDLLLRLSVFSGGWTVASATQVIGRAMGEDETCRLIAELVDKSLVHADLTETQPRYRMLGATRYYAARRLPQKVLDETRAEHARWQARIYERAEAEWPFMTDDDWAERYAPEIENLRAALHWALAPGGDGRLGVELASYTEHVWTELSLAAEQRHWFDQAIAAMEAATPPDVAGRLWLGRCGWLAVGDAQALAASSKAVELFRQVGSALDLGRALWRHAFQHISCGRLDAAEPLLQEAGAVLRASRESKALCSWLRASALACSWQGQLEGAGELLDEALSLAQRLRSRRDVALTLGGMAELHFAGGRLDEAIGTAQQALASLGATPNRSVWVQHVAGAIASYLLVRGDIARAATIANERLKAARMMGLPHEVVANVERLGLVAAHSRNLEAAGRLLGFSQSYHAARQRPRSFGSRAVYDRLLAKLHRGLPADMLEQLLSEGASLGDEAISEECLRIAASA
ncbi:ATP-binding protein [Elioraea rosea]|uniref:ATP-binding protein n=1 Tax=Elioraea rosea TaxID=2492390 RepID=UPI001315A615|nr:winged helix-turn-helix domain-containing protein [Elioraea rosea]